jgi:hypothetical protein
VFRHTTLPLSRPSKLGTLRTAKLGYYRTPPMQILLRGREKKFPSSSLMPFILSRRDAVYPEIGQREGSCGEIRVSRLHSLSKQLHRSFKLAIIYLIAMFMYSWYIPT